MTEPDTLDAVETSDADELRLAAARARLRLTEAPDVIGWVRAQMTPGVGGAQDGMPRSASKTPPLPLRADAVDDADDAFTRLLHWLGFWSARFNEVAPALIVTHWRVEGETAGFRAGTSPEGAQALTSSVTLWLLARHDRMLDEHTSRTYFDDVADIVWQLRSRYPTSPRRQRAVLDRACPLCDRFTYGAEWLSEDVTDFELRCSFCDHHQDAGDFLKAGRVRELMHELREEHVDPKAEWWTKRQALTELEMGRSTLDRYITEGLPTYTADSTVFVRVEELLALWREKRARQKATRDKRWENYRDSQKNTRSA